jgi:hypothetical protein
LVSKEIEMSTVGFGEALQAGFADHAQVLGVARFEAANRRRLSALVLGYPSRSTYQNWMKIAREHGEVTLDVDALMRLSAVFGIHQALGVLFADAQEQLGWLKGPHDAPLFGGQRPLSLITSGSLDGIVLVRRFLDAARGGVYMAPNGLDLDFPATTTGDIVWR